MTTQHAHPLVQAYLDDLDRRLAGAAPGERADIVDAVREHVDIALADLGHEPTTADVQQVLADLGPVDSVVAAWSAPTAGTTPTTAPQTAATDPATGPVTPSADRPRSTSWAVVVMLLLAGALVGVLLAPVALVLWFVVVPVVALAAVLSAVAWRQSTDERRRGRWRALFLVLTGALAAWALVAAAVLPFSVTMHEDSGTSVTSVPAPR